MARAQPYPAHLPLPDTLADEYHWLDLKRENLGLLGGRMVVVDYGEIT